MSSYGYKYPPSCDINNYSNPQYTNLPLYRNGMKSTTEISIDNNLPRWKVNPYSYK
jgi:hypothetical protein